jgi:hypothetical protein
LKHLGYDVEFVRFYDSERKVEEIWES